MHKLCAATYKTNANTTVAATELAMVWTHECYNIYADKLISVKDIRVYQVSGPILYNTLQACTNTIMMLT
jgi:hypothetical protein